MTTQAGSAPPLPKTWGDLRGNGTQPASLGASANAGANAGANTGGSSPWAAAKSFGTGGSNATTTTTTTTTTTASSKPSAGKQRHRGSLEDNYAYGSHVASCSVELRMKFIRKVYGIVGTQLLFTTIVTAFFQIPSVTTFIHAL